MPDPKSDSVSPANDTEKSEKSVGASQTQAVKDLEQASDQGKLTFNTTKTVSLNT